jgi:hypothetical protein
MLRNFESDIAETVSGVPLKFRQISFQDSAQKNPQAYFLNSAGYTNP